MVKCKDMIELDTIHIYFILCICLFEIVYKYNEKYLF